MLKPKTLAVTFALTSLAFASCDRDKGDDSSEDDTPTAWEFRNTADKSAFNTKLAELEKLSASADRGTVPAAQTRGDTKKLGSAWGILETYADAEGSVEAPASPDSPGCAQLMQIFGFGDQAETRGSGFALTDGGSCGDAVKEMKSFYSQSLDALKQQVAWLKSVAPGTEICGMRVEELAVDADSAAVGYKLVPAQIPAGMHYDQRVFGAANDAEVGYMTSLTAGCTTSTGDCEGSPDFSIVGLSEAIGKLQEKKLKLRNEFAFTMAFDDPKHGGKQDVTTSMKSQSEVSGLNDADLLKATESTTFELIGDPSAAPGAGAYKVTLSLNLEEVGEGRLRVSGSFLTNDSEEAPQSFRVEFRREGGACSVNTRVPDPESEPESPGTPGVPFDDTKLQGSWISECDTAGLGNFGTYSRYQEKTAFTAGQVTRSLTSFTDSECFPGKEAGTVTLTGKYTLSAELPDASRYDEISEYGLDLTYDTLTVLLADDGHVTRFNAEAVCNKTDWAKGVAQSFAAGACFFDLGNEPLLNDNVLRNKNEFTAVKPYANLVTLDMAQSTFYRGETATTRSRITSGSTRTLKHL